MIHKTVLHAAHIELGARMVDFSGWEMPLHYGSQMEEHRGVRERAGVFDVSHMNPVNVRGEQVVAFLRYVLANDVAKLVKDGQALYSCLLNESGGVLDDLIVYRRDLTHYQLILNAGTREKDMAWLLAQAKAFQVEVVPCGQFALLALQGPEAIALAAKALPDVCVQPMQGLKPFESVAVSVDGQDWMIARTGYTGEHGLEVMLPEDQALRFWQRVVAAGFMPCGLGARDTLRLEAGFHLYGSDMDETTTPLDVGLGWTVNWQDADRDFIGKQALIKQRDAGVKRRLIGLVLRERGVLRDHQTVLVDGAVDASDASKVGEITSGSFSPTLGHAIALARLPAVSDEALQPCSVLMRDRRVPVDVVKPPFVLKK